MKKGFLLLVAAATTTILVSCGGGNEAEAAKEYCDCFSKVAELQENMTSTDALMHVKSKLTNTIFLKNFSRFDPLPRGGNFDQDTVVTNS